MNEKKNWTITTEVVIPQKVTPYVPPVCLHPFDKRGVGNVCLECGRRMPNGFRNDDDW